MYLGEYGREIGGNGGGEISCGYPKVREYQILINPKKTLLNVAVKPNFLWRETPHQPPRGIAQPEARATGTFSCKCLSATLSTSLTFDLCTVGQHFLLIHCLPIPSCGPHISLSHS